MPRNAAPTTSSRKPEVVPAIPADLADEPVEAIEPVSYPAARKDEPVTDWALDPDAAEVDDVRQPVRALTTVASVSQHHVVVGMGTLAELPEEEYQLRKAAMARGIERMQDIVRSILVEGEDFGRVSGIDRPFLHQPGAEKLANFYGLAVEQQAERITRKDGEGLDVPPFAYHVKSYVHLGSFDGPVVAQGYGEANVYEDRYRYRNEQPTCPECGRQGLIKRKSPPNLAGKWNCPNWGGKGGCNRIFEPNDERIKSGGKVENPDLWGLAETILLMASKRSLVSSVRRATGTSGLFTQDPESPSVRQQVEGAGPSDDSVPEAKLVENAEKVERGGKTAEVTAAQIAQLSATSRAKDIGPAKIAEVIERLFDAKVDFGEATDRAAQSQVILAAIKALGGDKAGALLYSLETGEIPKQ